MTKKSLARQQRDEVAKNAQQSGVKSLYAVLEDMHEQQRGMFGQYAKMIQLISHDHVRPFLDQPERVNILLKGMSADIDELLSKTELLYQGHRGKAGFPDPTDEDEHFNIIQMQQQYMIYLNVHQQNLMPVMFELDEHLNRALAVLRQRQADAISNATAQNTAPVENDPSFANAPVVEQQPNTVQVNGMTVRADGQGWTQENVNQSAAAPTSSPYEAPAIDTNLH
jgi:hypothetical protein